MYNNVNVLFATDYALIVKMANYMSCVFYHNKKKITHCSIKKKKSDLALPLLEI